ncbi:MAG: MFS transporter [Candidatus Hodarchaeota archaeon]
MDINNQNNYKVADDHFKAYRTWPIFVLSFIRLFYVSIFERALQNHLYFIIDISESTLGIISSIGAIAYIFAPLIGQVITSRIGIRNGIIISSITTVMLTGAQIIYFEPWYLITCRILLGLSIGLLWPNLFNLLSKWQNVISKKESKNNFRNFNFSWNFGFVGGLLIGYFWAFIWSDYLAMIISWFLSFLLIPFSFFIKKEEKLNGIKAKSKFKLTHSISEEVIKGSPVNNINTPMTVYPILFSWIGIIFLTISKALFRFSYPIFLKDFSSPSYLSYIILFGLQSTQLLGLTWINSMKVYSRKISVILSISIIMLFAIFILYANNILYISIISMTVGLFLGLIHGTSMKIMLQYGTAKNTTKFSTINEILVGAGFGLTPIFAGYVAEVNIYLMFIFIIILGVLISIVLLYLSRNVKRVKIV